MDSSAIKAIIEAGQQLFQSALKASPTEGNGYGVALGLFALVALYLGVTAHLDRRDAKAYRATQDEKANARELAASQRAIAEQESRDRARERVIEEQRLHRDDLKASFGAIVEPLESRIGDLERRERKHSESIILLRYKIGIEPPQEGD